MDLSKSPPESLAPVLDDDLILFCSGTGLGPANDPGRQFKVGTDLQDTCCGRIITVDFQSMAHVENLVHLRCANLTGVKDGSKDRWSWKQIVFDIADATAKIFAFDLATAGAVDDASNRRTILGEDFFDDRQVGSGR